MSIAVEKICKSFNRKWVLKDISLTASDGEILGLIGPSGAGKTTLIRLITGAITADSGDISMGDLIVPDSRLSRRFGFMPQTDALYPDLTCAQNLQFFGGLYAMTKGETEYRTKEVLKLLELTKERDTLVSEFSGGMKKRLSLAVALLHDPEYLILDEPTVGIDPILRKKVWDKFEHLASIGKTIIVATHVMDEAVRCNKCALLNHGKLIAFDTVPVLKATTESGKLEDVFLVKEKEDEANG